MRTKSAETLNDADRTQRIIDWVLFCQENEANLRVMHGEDWEPGIPLQGWATNIARPMFQLLDDDHLLTHDYFPSIMRCKDCQVTWKGDDPCWLCGKDCGPQFMPFPPDVRGRLHNTLMSGHDRIQIPSGVLTSNQIRTRLYLPQVDSNGVEYEYEVDFNRYRVRVGDRVVLIDREALLNMPQHMVPEMLAYLVRSMNTPAVFRIQASMIEFNRGLQRAGESIRRLGQAILDECNGPKPAKEVVEECPKPIVHPQDYFRRRNLPSLTEQFRVYAILKPTFRWNDGVRFRYPRRFDIHVKPTLPKKYWADGNVMGTDSIKIGDRKYPNSVPYWDRLGSVRGGRRDAVM